jgi:glycosyltransferase involved in cell wall biosynthesis
MRIAIATDAYYPQVNGVVRSLGTTVSILLDRGYEIELITPDRFLTIPMPGYREIRLAVAPRFGARRALHAFKPDVVHIVTEGPIGWSARAWCLAHDVPFTTAFHTRFPDYVAVRTGISAERFWPIMRRFHAPSRAVLVSTARLMAELQDRGVRQTRLWSRGIDAAQFRPGLAPHPVLANLPKPVLLSVGRVSAEKNLPAFLGAPVAGTKVVVGDGPALIALKQQFPDAVFLGALQGDSLARAYAAADVFVFPSLTDTFGLVMIEAMACGVPVAGFPVAGPLDIVGVNGRGPDDRLDKAVGALDPQLSKAILKAQSIDRNAVAAYGRSFDWNACTDQFIAAIDEAGTSRRGADNVEAGSVASPPPSVPA